MKHSEQTNEVFKAMTKFRSQLKQPMKDANNPFFKSAYVPLENIVMVIDEAIKDTGLNYMQEVNSETRQVDTIVTHESGQWFIVQGAKVNPVKNDPQAEGSAVSYAKRYSLSACFGITSDKDDDGNKATNRSNAGSFGNNTKKPVQNQVPKPRATSTGTSDKIMNLAKERGYPELDKLKPLGDTKATAVVKTWLENNPELVKK